MRATGWLAAAGALMAASAVMVAPAGASNVPLNTWVPDTGVQSVSVDTYGRTYLGGDFRNFGPRTGSMWHLTATSDVPAQPFPEFAGAVNAIVPDGAGGWYVGGNFTYAGGTPHARLAHVLADGTVDPAWTPSVGNDCAGTLWGDPGVNALLLSGSDLYVAGCFKSVNGQFRANLAKISATGSGALDPSFTTGADAPVLAMTESNGELVAGGEFSGIGGQTRNNIAKLSMTGAGAVDTTWNPNADNGVESLAASGNDVFAGGQFKNIGGQSRNYVAKLAADGTGAANAAWDPNANDNVDVIVVSGNDVYIGGEFRGPAGFARVARIPINGNGATDGWGPAIAGDDGIGGGVRSIAVSGDDVYLGGNFRSANGGAQTNLVKVSASTNTVDPNWHPKPNSDVRALAVTGADVYAGGRFTMYTTVARAGLARLNADGTLDMTWNPDATPSAGQRGTGVQTVAAWGDHLYVGGGGPIFIAGQAHQGLVRVSVNGTGVADSAWNPDIDGTGTPVVGSVLAMAMTDRDLYLGGTFLNVGGQPRAHLAKVSLTGTGAVDPTWNPGAENGNVYSLLLSGKSIFVGGSFLSAGGGTTNRGLAKLAASGTGAVDPTWTVDAGGSVAVVQGLAALGNDLFVGGAFTHLGPYQRITMGKVSTVGGGVVDRVWDPGVDFQSPGVHSVAVANGDVYAGGEMRALGVPDHHSDNLSKLSATGSGAGDLGWGAGADSSVESLSTSGTRLAAGGGFLALGTGAATGAAVFDLPVIGPVFAPIETVSATGSTAPISVATTVDSAGNATLAWVSTDVGDTHPRVHVRTRSADGTLGSTQVLALSSEAKRVTTAMTAGGEAVIVWESSNGTNQRIVATRRSSAGVVQPPKVLSVSGQDATEPQVMIGEAGRATVVWVRPDASGSPRVQSRTVAADMTLGGIRNLSKANTSASHVRVAANASGDKIVTWAQTDGGGNRIWARVLSPDETVGPVRNFAIGFFDNVDPDVAMDAAGNATIVWKTLNAPPAGLIYGRRMRTDGSLGLTRRLSYLGLEIVGPPHVAVTPAGDAQVAWANRPASGGTANWILARSFNRDGTLSAVSQVSVNNQTANEPHVAINDNGVATIVYNREDRGLLARSRASDGVMSSTRTVVSGSIATAPALLGIAGTKSGVVALFATPTGAVRATGS